MDVETDAIVWTVPLSAANGAGRLAGKVTKSLAVKFEAAVVVKVSEVPVAFPAILLSVAVKTPLLVTPVTVALFEAPLLLAAVTEPVRVVDVESVDVVPNFQAH